MKKMFLSLVATMFITATVFAEENQPTTAKWEGEINTYKLTQYLKLSASQTDEVSNICDYFAEQMRRANHSKSNNDALLYRAVFGNLKLMKQVLTPEQYKKYATVLNVTLNNKGIEVPSSDKVLNK